MLLFIPWFSRKKTFFVWNKNIPWHIHAWPNISEKKMWRLLISSEHRDLWRNTSIGLRSIEIHDREYVQQRCFVKWDSKKEKRNNSLNLRGWEIKNWSMIYYGAQYFWRLNANCTVFKEDRRFLYEFCFVALFLNFAIYFFHT